MKSHASTISVPREQKRSDDLNRRTAVSVEIARKKSRGFFEHLTKSRALVETCPATWRRCWLHAVVSVDGSRPSRKQASAMHRDIHEAAVQSEKSGQAGDA